MKRDTRIDALRTLALLLLFLAHVSPPSSLFVVRFFDVPLMTMLLGMSYYLSRSKRQVEETYCRYIRKRTKRLLFPAWIYITLYLLMVYLLSRILNRPFPFSRDTILQSYTLIKGFDYVWIIGVFFVIAIFLPIIYLFSNKITNIYFRLIIITGLLISQKYLCVLSRNYSGNQQILISQIPIYFGYLIIASIGVCIIRQTYKETSILLAYCSLILVYYLTKYPFTSLMFNKYPPTIFYLSYGISISIFLFLIISAKIIRQLTDIKIIKWISTHSLELYYWHTFPLCLFKIFKIQSLWWQKYICIILIAFLGTIIQQKIKNLFISKTKQTILTNN